MVNARPWTLLRYDRIREVNKNVAVAIIEEALACDMTTKIGKRQLAEGIDNLVSRKMYYPAYVPLVDDSRGWK